MPTYTIRHRRDTTANWQAANPILLDGEVGYERTEGGRLLTKMGDGVCGADGTVTGTHWNDLPYCSGPAGPSPQFEWSGTSLRIKNPDGTWGEWIDLRGPQGIQGIQGVQGDSGVAVPATRTTLGGVIVGEGLRLTAEGCVSVGAFATCETAANVAAKSVTLEGFSLYAGAPLNLLFTEVNTATDLTLAINGGEPKPILVDGVAPEVGDLAKGQIYSLMYSGEAWQILAGMARDRICQTVWFEDTLSRPGYAPLNGGTIADFSVTFPQAMAYLQTSHGQARCFESLEARTAAHVAIWHTLASGATVGWEGVGGLTKFFYDETEDKLYLPDLRGMFRAAAGDGVVAPSMGGVAGDRTRPVEGSINGGDNNAGYLSLWDNSKTVSSGALTAIAHRGFMPANNQNETCGLRINLDTALVLPTGAVNSPRAWGALACAYLGHPAA